MVDEVEDEIEVIFEKMKGLLRVEKKGGFGVIDDLPSDIQYYFWNIAPALENIDKNIGENRLSRNDLRELWSLSKLNSINEGYLTWLISQYIKGSFPIVSPNDRELTLKTSEIITKALHETIKAYNNNKQKSELILLNLLDYFVGELGKQNGVASYLIRSVSNCIFVGHYAILRYSVSVKENDGHEYDVIHIVLKDRGILKEIALDLQNQNLSSELCSQKDFVLLDKTWKVFTNGLVFDGNKRNFKRYSNLIGNCNTMISKILDNKDNSRSFMKKLFSNKYSVSLESSFVNGENLRSRFINIGDIIVLHIKLSSGESNILERKSLLLITENGYKVLY